ncbi:hypothetical protein OAL10_10910 [Gammaproteobacteria bacterium]|nr:hypothetical protein [Gammaproteobacteria bacterium]
MKPRVIFQKLVSSFFIIIILTGCASNVSTPRGSYGLSVPVENTAKLTAGKLSVVIPIMDPGLPKNTDEYLAKAIWPELRRAESNRFSVMLKNSMEKTKAFTSVRVVPDKTAQAHLYAEGRIVKSNGEDLHLTIEVSDIAGKTRLRRTYRHRVKEYDLEDPRKNEADLYAPIFEEIAEDIAALGGKMRTRDLDRIKIIEELSFAHAFSPEYFSNYISVSNKGRKKLVYAPDEKDPMLKRIKALRIRDQMFIDNIQTDYNEFRMAMDKDYVIWQRQSYVESKAAREAKAAATTSAIFGTLLLAGGIAAAASSDYYDPALYGGAVAAGVGAAVIKNAVEKSRDAKAHRESLSELGKSLNIQITPRVMELEDREIKLEGTAHEQYKTWRLFLKDFYELESTPDVII